VRHDRYGCGMGKKSPVNEQHLLCQLREGLRGALEADRAFEQDLATRLEARWDTLVENSGPLREWRTEMEAALVAERVVEQDIVAGLSNRWKDFTDDAFKDGHKFEALLAKLDKISRVDRDPAMLPVHLLGVIDQVRREKRHTALLCHLLSPSPKDAGKLGLALLRAFLALVDDAPAFQDAELERTKIHREPCWTKPDTDEERYPDFLIEIPSLPASTWVVVENKIDHQDTQGQLDDYAELADLKLKGGILRVFLTPRGHKPEMSKNPGRWQCLGYRKLALAWRRVLALHDKDDAWTWILRLYLASVLQEIVGIGLSTKITMPQRATVIDYLEAATEGATP
jgi:hypothetical protein